MNKRKIGIYLGTAVLGTSLGACVENYRLATKLQTTQDELERTKLEIKEATNDFNRYWNLAQTYTVNSNGKSYTLDPSMRVKILDISLLPKIAIDMKPSEFRKLKEKQ